MAFYFMIRVLDFGLLGIWWGIFGITWAAALAATGAGRHYLKRIPAADRKRGVRSPPAHHPFDKHRLP